MITPRCSFALKTALLVFGLGLSGLFGTPDPARAQSPSISSATPDGPPYEQQLMRLAEVLGALHSLRPLCGEHDQPDWRQRMVMLLDAETEPGNRRRRYIERFNQGYRGFSSTYRTCTDSARLAMEHYMQEGQTLIAEVLNQYSR